MSIRTRLRQIPILLLVGVAVAAPTCADGLLTDRGTPSEAEGSSSSQRRESVDSLRVDGRLLRRQAAELYSRYRNELSELASRLRNEGDAPLADRVANWVPAGLASADLQSGEILFLVGDPYVAQPACDNISPPQSASDMGLPSAWRRLRQKYAEELFQLARRAAAAGQASLALQLATNTLRENGEHVAARRVLGYDSVRQPGNRTERRWGHDYSCRMMSKEKIWDSRFGWIEQDDLPRWLRGEQRDRKGWVSGEIASKRHADMARGWVVRSDHFLVTTDHSLAAGATLAAKLERLFQVWRQLFAAYTLEPDEIDKLFVGERRSKKIGRTMRVYLHRDRQAYIEALQGRQPRIAETLGIYFDQEQEAHFFAGQDQVEATLQHEAVHQLFQQSRRATKRVGELFNFWIVEGVALYFESLQVHDDPTVGWYATIGQPGAGRLPTIRDNGLPQRLPFAEIVDRGRRAFQRQANLSRAYTDAAARATFLMQGSGGTYREPLVAYLRSVYAGKDRPETLVDLCGGTWDDLDTEFAGYIERLP